MVESSSPQIGDSEGSGAVAEAITLQYDVGALATSA